MNMGIFLLVAIMVPVFILLMFTPYWTRKTESFGVSIPEDIYHTPEIKAMRKQYVWAVGMLSAVVMGTFLLLSEAFVQSEDMLGIVFSIIIVAYMIVGFLIYLHFHSKMKARKKEANWSEEKSQLVVIDTRFRKEKLTYSNLWFLLPFAIAIGTMVITLNAYELIPEKIPMQYNFSGEVTNYANKSYRSVLLTPIMQVYLTLLFLLINTIIGRAKQQVSANNPEKSMQQNIIFRRRWSAFNIITGMALTLMFSLTQLSYIYPINQQILTIMPLIFSFGIVLGAIVLVVTTGQGGSRVKVSKGENGSIIDRDDDKYWKMGQFYFNKNDPALFLEKRFGVGWTNNWAHPLSWIILLVIIGIAAGLPILLGG
ncbi:DUF1648 domain-containing protein [Virgibacillus dakarensis]|nr:DUF1648 domain-containing protein [Virgibacillus dakarensis]